jgi:hypothetical protein
MGAKSGGGTVTPAPASMPNNGYVYVGPALGSIPNGTLCLPQGNPATQKIKCFLLYALRAVAADSITNHKVYVVYNVTTATSSTIYFTESTGGASSFGTFTTPEQLTTTGFNYEPNVTVDTRGNVFVSFVSFKTFPDTTGSASFHLRMRPIDGTGVWLIATPPAAWNISTIQYHCFRRTYFFSDFRDSRTFGNRTYLSYEAGGTTTTPYGLFGGWVSRWTLTN